MNVPVLILLMLGVTFIPRAIPAVLADKMKFGSRFERFINLIPYTAMTALVFPGVLSLDSSNIWIGILGGGIAILLSCIPKIPSAVVVVGAVASVILLYLIF